MPPSATLVACEQDAPRTCEPLSFTTICSDGPLTEDSACLDVDPWTIERSSDPGLFAKAELTLTKAPSGLLGPTSEAITLTAPTGTSGSAGGTSTGTTGGTTTGSTPTGSSTTQGEPKPAVTTTLTKEPTSGGTLGSGTVSDTICIESYPLCAPGWSESTMGQCCQPDGTRCGCKTLVSPSGGICASPRHPGGVRDQ